MSKNPKLTHFVSEIDQFLQEYDRTHPALSLSQKKEIAKYQRIYDLRDNTMNAVVASVKKLWEKF